MGSTRFEAMLYGAPRGKVQRIFQKSEQYEAIIVLPQATLESLAREVATDTTDGGGDDAADEQSDAAADGQNAGAMDHDGARPDYRYLVEAIEGNISRMFSLEWDGESEEWIEAPFFSLPSDYSPENLAELLWRAAEYRCYQVGHYAGTFFFLVYGAVAEEIDKRLEERGRFSARLAEVVLRSYIGGETRDVDTKPFLSVNIRNQREFVLGPFLFPRQVALGKSRPPVRYLKLVVGLCVPESGILVTMSFTLNGIKQQLHYVFPALRNKPEHKALAKSLVRQSLSGIRRRLDGVATLEPGTAKFSTSFTWDDYMFVLQAAVPINDVRLPVWVYAPIDYVYLLYELLGVAVAWDIRKKSLFTMMLTLVNLNQHVYQKLVIDGEMVNSGLGARGSMTLIRDILGTLPDNEASRLIHSIMIGNLGYSGRELKVLFYYVTIAADGSSFTRTVPHLNLKRLVRLLPRIAREDFTGGHAASASWDELVDRNETALRQLFEVRLGGQVELPTRLQIFLDSRFLPDHNADQLSLIQGCIEECNLSERLRAMRPADAQNRLLSIETETLALALMYDKEADADVRRLVNDRYREEIDYHLRRLRALHDARSLDLKRVVTAMHDVLQRIPDFRDAVP